MTLKEAKKILKKEGFLLSLASKVINQTGAIREFEKPEVCEAIKVANSNRWTVGLSPIEWDEREARLKKEYEKNTKAPGPGEEQPKEGNPALKYAASQFNDALLDEQAKEIARLKKIIHKKNMKIEELRKERSIHLRGKVKLFGETVDLSQEICDKNEEIRLSKIREKNLTEVCQKYMKENEKLKKELADKVVDKIDAQVLKSAESALAEKDEVIADLGKELKAQKDLVDDISLKYDGAKHNLKLRMDECEKLKKELEEKTKLVEIVRNDSKQFCYYGISAEKMIQKMANVIVYGKPVSSEDFKEYRRLANGYRFNPQLPELSEEEKKLTAKTLDFNAKCMKAARESINDVFESYAAKYAKSTLDDLKEKAYESFNAKAHNLGLVGSKDENGILDQMKDNTHPTEDNPEEVEVDEILERVRKALEEGHTVSIDYDKAEEGADQSGKIVLCGKDFGKILNENGEAAEELSKVLDDVIDQFLLFGEVIIKTEK